MNARMWNHSEWVECVDPRELLEKYTALLSECGFNILQVVAHEFEPQGYTALWLLSESHFAIHTFPEMGKTYIELSSCNLDYFVKFIEIHNSRINN